MNLTPYRRLLIVALFCALVVWFAGTTGRFVLVLALLLLAPGYLIERFFPSPAPLPLSVRPAIWLGLSISVVALLYQWATAFGLVLTAPVLQLLAALLALGSVWYAWQDLGAAPPGRLSQLPVLLALLAVFTLTLWTRFEQIRDLVLPPWVDSVHHALMVQVAAERGQVPYTLQPYLPVENLPYHWGYHVFTAAVMQISGSALPQVMLWEGQILNALHVLTCAALANYLWRRPLAGVVAGIVIGLISIMPAYYVSWGRYTQLTGLLLLPALAIVWHAGLRAPSRRWVLLAALLFAGLSTIHFRVLIFTLALIAVMSASWAMVQGWAALRSRLLPACLSAGSALVLAGPWLLMLTLRRLQPVIARPQELIGGGSYNALSEELLWAGQNRMLVALALAAAVWVVWQRRQAAVDMLGWVAALVLLANPWLISYAAPSLGALAMVWAIQRRHVLLALAGGGLLLLNPALVRLPYLWLIPNDVVVISLFIPLGVLIGGGVALLADRVRLSLTAPVATTLHALGAVALGAVAIWGAGSLRSVINPTTMLASPADLAAITWAATHTPADARFLVNSAPWLPDANRTNDGSWWLVPLARRWVSTPPVLYVYGPPDYVREVQALNKEVAAYKPGQEEQIYQLIAREGITHIYLNQRSGPLTTETFAANSNFTPVYEHDGVTILAVYPQE